ncbi:MAG: MFS transporter [Proteobacteria bacterium]|nr:MAG: MFS transporter [Pseudomonadota bacterium]
MNSRTLLLGLVFLSSSFNFAQTLQPMLLTESGALLPIQAGLTLAMGSLLSGLMQPYIGNLLDHGRVKRGFSLVAICYALGVFGYWHASAPGWQLVISCLFIIMAGMTLRTIVSMALIASCQGSERAEAASMRYLVSNAALAVSASIALFLFKEWRRELLMVDFVTSLVLAGGMLYHLKKKMRDCGRPRTSLKESKAVLLEAMKTHGRRITGLSLVTVCFSANLTYIPLLFAKRGMATTDISAMVLMMNAIIVILSAKPLRRLTRHWRPQRIGKIGTGLIAAGMCFAPLTSSINWVMLGIVIWTVGEVIFIPWEQLQLFNCFDNTTAGLASGAVSFLFSICQILAPVLSTALLSLPDEAAAVVLTLLPIMGYWIYRSTEKPHSGVVVTVDYRSELANTETAA